MTLAEQLNDCFASATATKGVVEVVPNDNDYPERFFDDVEAYLDRGHNDEPFTYYVEKDGKRAKWNESEGEWENCR